MLPGLIVVVAVHLSLKHQPLFIATPHNGKPLHLVYDLVHQPLEPLGQVAVSFLTFDRFQLRRQLLHKLLGVWMVAYALPHTLHQLQHGAPCFPHQLVPGLCLLLIKVEHLISEDVVGQLGFDLTDALFGEAGLSGLY